MPESYVLRLFSRFANYNFNSTCILEWKSIEKNIVYFMKLIWINVNLYASEGEVEEGRTWLGNEKLMATYSIMNDNGRLNLSKCFWHYSEFISRILKVYCCILNNDKYMKGNNNRSSCSNNNDNILNSNCRSKSSISNCKYFVNIRDLQ